MKRAITMKRHCEYCFKELSDDARIDLRFCSNSHRTKFNNDKRRVKLIFEKALKAIKNLEEIGHERNTRGEDANNYLIRLHLHLKTDDKNNVR